MRYHVLIMRRAQKALEKIKGADYERIKSAITGLGNRLARYNSMQSRWYGGYRKGE